MYLIIEENEYTSCGVRIPLGKDKKRYVIVCVCNKLEDVIHYLKTHGTDFIIQRVEVAEKFEAEVVLKNINIK